MKLPIEKQISNLKIAVVIGEYIHPFSLLCTDTATNYKKFARIKGLQHKTINERQKQRVKKGIYHIQHVNNFHNRLKGWMKRFQGVGTRYLETTYTGSVGSN